MLYWFIRFPNNRLFYQVLYKMQTKDKQQSVYGLILDTCAGLIQITCITSDSIRNEISRIKWQESLKY